MSTRHTIGRPVIWATGSIVVRFIADCPPVFSESWGSVTPGRGMLIASRRPSLISASLRHQGQPALDRLDLAPAVGHPVRAVSGRGRGADLAVEVVEPALH